MFPGLGPIPGVNVTGGSGDTRNYTYWWRGVPPPCPSWNTRWFGACAPAYPGNWTVHVQVNDTSGGETATSPPFWINVVRSDNFSVTFLVRPASCGPIRTGWYPPGWIRSPWNVTLANGSVETFRTPDQPPDVQAGVLACAGYRFVEWQESGGVVESSAGPLLYNGTLLLPYAVDLTISGNGSLAAEFAKVPTPPSPLALLLHWPLVLVPIVAVVLPVLLLLLPRWLRRRGRRRLEEPPSADNTGIQEAVQS
ncbi:MAG: hypothetical protein KGI89_14240 [Euryarchaeota archaeon]|nr:hypothetical protein [Euryarchaeota archaeon]